MKFFHKHEINLYSLIFAFMLISRVLGSHESGQALELLENLRQQLDRPLLFVVLDENNSKSLDDLSDDDDNDNDREDADNNQNLKDSRNDAIDENRAYLLYSVLRTRDESGSAPEEFPEAKKLLRAALIGRCRNLDVCNNKCTSKPRPKKYKCKISCQEVFDNLNMCDTIKPQQQDDCHCQTQSCVRKCRGLTMPPSWRLLRSLLKTKK